jgi:transposase
MELSGIKAELIGHLGLVAGILQDTGIMDKVDKQLGLVQGGVKYGHRVGAMILNGLGFINTALYMTPRFFHDKPISVLLGEGVTAEQLNDDSLGRCLDKIAAYGTTKWYSEIALQVVSTLGLLSRRVHLDSTTLSLYGNYDVEESGGSPQPLWGYSKDHRPDLKQVTLQCVTLGKAALPIWMEALDGNSSDKKSFPETVRRVDAFYRQVKDAPKMCFVADSALYNERLDELGVDWLTRVPETYGEAKLLCEQREMVWEQTQDERYRVCEYFPKNKKERWLLVRSEPAFHREKERLLRKHAKLFDELYKALWHCSCQEFNCEEDAKKSIEKIIRAKQHRYEVSYQIEAHPKYNNKGRPSKDQLPDSMMYQVKINGIASDLESIEASINVLGRFVLATNVLDKTVMSNEAMLVDYKEQGEIERGFRFIKNDTLGLDEVYLKKPARIGALMAIMTLCLLVYGLTQYRIRDSLEKHNEVLPDQKKKPTKKPTLMWIFTLFSSVTMIRPSVDDGRRVVVNLHPFHQKVILLLGGNARKIYLLPETMQLNHIELNQKNWLKWCGI